MRKLVFQRDKYGKELLIDAARVDELEIVDDVLITNFYLIGLLEEAQGDMLIDDEQVELRDRSAIFIKPGQVNQVGDTHFRSGAFLFFEGGFLDEFFNDPFFIFKFAYFHDSRKPAILDIESADFSPILQVALELREEIDHLRSDSAHLLRSMLYYILIRLNRLYSDRYQAYGGLITNPYILRFQQLLERHIREFHQVRDYAEALGISRTYLNKACRQYLGKTSREAIQDRLLLEAKRELIFTEKDVAEVAYDLNFKAPPHFVRFFKKNIGSTPGRYRKEFSNW